MLDNLPTLSRKSTRQRLLYGLREEPDLACSTLLVRGRVSTDPRPPPTWHSACDQKTLAVGVTFSFYRLWLSWWFMLLYISPNTTNVSRWSLIVVHVKPFLLLISLVWRQMVSFYHYSFMFWPGHLLIKVWMTFVIQSEWITRSFKNYVLFQQLPEWREDVC